MSRIILFPAIFILLVSISACSSGGTDPISPAANINMDLQASAISGNSQTHLWGYFDIQINFENQTVEAIPNRNAAFTANLVNFLNSNPLNLQFNINDTPIGLDYVDVDIDVGITHPFPGLPQYNGYDVRGIFMGDGSAELTTAGVFYPMLGTDQSMLPDPDDPPPGNGGPDGYTRWFNITEFAEPAMPMFGYTQGSYATSGFNGTATLCPYKYFADGLGADDDLWVWLNAHADQNGIFSSGATNERNYYIRFPNDKGVTFGYAVIANWGGTEPEYHPSNAPEAVTCDIDYSGDVWYLDPNQFGGDIILDISVWDWGVVSAGVGDYNIIIESTLRTNPYPLNPTEMIPVDGAANYSTYHTEIAADVVPGLDGNTCWVIVEYPAYDYSNDFGVTNDADSNLMAFFQTNELTIINEAGNLPPVCDVQVITSMPASGWGIVVVEFDASGSSDPESGPLTYAWDFNNDGTFGDSYDSGTDDNPTKNFSFDNTEQVCVRVTDDQDESTQCCVDVDIDVLSAKNIPLRTDEAAVDLAVEPNGNLLILYEDAQVWRYTEAGYFSQGSASYVFTGQVVPWTGNAQLTNFRIDVNPNGYIIASAESGACDGTHGYPAQNFSSTGTQLGSAGSGCTAGPVPDVMAFKNPGSYSYSHVVMAPYNSATNYQNNMYRKFQSFGGPSWTQNYGPGPFSGPQTGYDGLWLGYVQGAETVDGQRWWVVKDPGNPSTNDYYASRWNQSTYFYYYYDNMYFGTGSQTDDDDGWYNAQDLTIDSSGYLYVLDELSSGQGRIKLFEEGNPGTALTDNAAGDVSTISDTPLRIEGSDFVSPTYGNLIFVLHGDTAPFKLSVFFPSDFDF